MKSELGNPYQLVLMPSGQRGAVHAGETVLDAARSLGVEIESICGGRQTCGKCLVEPEKGVFQKLGIESTPENLSAPEDGEQAYADDHGIDLSRRRLACAARIEGDVLVMVPEESQARKQVIRKEASPLTLTIEPAMRLYYVEVPPAQLGGESDWDRLRMALKAEWELSGLHPDPLLLRSLQGALRSGGWGVTATVWMGNEVIRVEPGFSDRLYGLAVDVGSTTVAAYLCDLRTGVIVAAEATMNPQIRYGEDLMSRVSYAMTEPQGTQRMQRAIIASINELAIRTAEKAGIAPNDITDLVLVGNTVMHHLFLGINPVELGGAPFALVYQDALDMKARDLGLHDVHPAAKAHILACIAGHVGADNVGVLLAEQPALGEEVSLIVDIGTNAEILLGTKDRMLSASSPTGPAFEGAQISNGQRAAPGAIERVRIDPDTLSVRYRVIGDERWSDALPTGESLDPTGICGSGIIEAIAELFTRGLIDASGVFTQEAEHRSPAVRRAGRTAELVLASVHDSAAGKELVVTQADIRAIQLAKGALYAGVRLLMQELGVAAVDKIKLSGAFGSYIDPKYAMLLGMIPDCALDQVEAIGNAAGDGARIALLNIGQREAAQKAARRVEYIETALHPSFQDAFVAAMSLPHAVDTFPHLSGLLPEPAAPRRRNKRRAEKKSAGPPHLKSPSKRVR